MPPAHCASRPTLCVDFGGGTIRLAIVDRGVVQASTTLPNRSQPSDLDAVARVGRELLAAVDHGASGHASEGVGGAQRDDPPRRAVGLALPGIVDARSGRLLAAHGKYAYLHDVDLRAWAADTFSADAVVENDARAALVGETTYGCAAGARDAVMVILGTGVGTAALMDGRLVRGRSGHAGVLGGHLTVTLDAVTCNCGNVGCAEAVAGTWALSRTAAGRAGWEVSPLAEAVRRGDLGFADVAAAASSGDPFAMTLRDDVVRVWAVTAVNLCHSYDPAVVIFSGAPMLAGTEVLDALREHVESHLWSSLVRPEIVVASDPTASVLLGLDRLVELDHSTHTPPSAEEAS